MADPADSLSWVLGPAQEPAPVPAPAVPAEPAVSEDPFAAFLLAAAGPEPAPAEPAPAPALDEWEQAGLRGVALDAMRLWSCDLREFSKPDAPAWQKLIAAALRQLLEEVRANPKAFNDLAGSCS